MTFGLPGRCSIYGRFPDISHGFFMEKSSPTSLGNNFLFIPLKYAPNKISPFGGTPFFHVRKKKLFETPLPVPATERG